MAIVAMASSLVCATVYAQGPTSSSSASTGPGASEGHKLNLRFAAFGSYSNNVMADLAREVPGAIDARRPDAGLYSGLTGGLNYGYLRQAKTFFAVDARTTGSYYPDYQVRALQHMADVNVSRPLGGRTTVRFGQNARIADHYRLELFPDMRSGDAQALLALDDQYAVLAIKTYSYVTTTGLSRMLTKRASVGANYRFRYVDSPQADFNFMSHDAGASFSYQLTRYGSLRASYNYREVPRYNGSGGDDPPFKSHGVNLGIDYNRAFSLSGRRTSLTFATGSALLAAAREEQEKGNETTTAHLRPVLQGTVNLRRNLARTWDAQASYRRFVHFIEGFTDPLFTEAVSAGVSGQVGRYFRTDAMFAHSFGGVGRGKIAGKSYGSKSVSAQFARPLTNQISTFVEYLYLRQHLGKDVVLPTGFAHSLNRHSVRVGISLGLSLIP